ncbi:integral membrane protein [Streptomyces zinciresistens K42]|uniref:Integral membrane protein n=1 Tax=Streptomyces zinciresistens K42 TaxID=700597 RepID=G2GL50_9ACTN|nr:integral membrane protein [Streptomyces zinciresistens K42]
MAGRAPRTGAEPAAPPRPAPSQQRDACFDDAECLAVGLDAVGHAGEPLWDGSRPVTALYMFVHAFHPPAFIILSGCLSRGFEGRPEQPRRLVTALLVPYVVFGTAYTPFTRWTDPGRSARFTASPSGPRRTSAGTTRRGRGGRSGLRPSPRSPSRW